MRFEIEINRKGAVESIVGRIPIIHHFNYDRLDKSV